MITGILLMSLGLFVVYLIIDFGLQGGDINKFFDKWVLKTLWIWLPFYALRRLFIEVVLKKEYKFKK
jgi:hypothetical protein